MRLEDIGFYTLSDERAANASDKSPLKRCEILITDKCNFKCPYCRGLNQEISGVMRLDKVKSIVDFCATNNIENIRFSGGEPTTYLHLKELVSYTKEKCDKIQHIAISTNGSADLEYYKQLIDLGVNDFSISLDACCSAFGDKMSGTKGVWDKVIDNIRELSKLTYVTVGVVLTDENISELLDIIKFASGLGVADIRIISSAQSNIPLNVATSISDDILEKHKILKYRINNIKNGRNVRGIKLKDSPLCPLVMDDIAIAGNYHYPCIIYLREGGEPIGELKGDIRKQRMDWCFSHFNHVDPICSKNCLDVCIDYNNKVMNFLEEK
jgi:MoaA/NifB/PqqE/SkfB family radical SAM enzyme